MKPVCVRCQVEFKVFENGITVAELFRDKQVYRLWQADIWKCAGCGAEVVFGFGNEPRVEHYEEDLKSALENIKANGGKIVFSQERI